MRGAKMASQEYPKASNAVVYGGMIIFVAFFILLMSFSCPYWISSYDETFSSFKNMGLWEYCFEDFRYPNFQFDKKFNGCHWIFSAEYQEIREWLLPGWLMVVQTFVTIPFILSSSSLIIIAAIVTRYPLRFVLRYEWLLSAIAAINNAVAGGLLFLAIIIFPAACHKRSWLMYPTFNHLSWGYGLAVISFMLHCLGAFFIYLDARAGYTLRKESRNLVMQMQTNP